MPSSRMSTDSEGAHQGCRHGILSLSIRQLPVLSAAYMPFLKRGGLFIPTRRDYALGDPVFLLLSLPEQEDRLPLAGRVAWITPDNAQHGGAAGIGIHFDEEEGLARRRIEALLVGIAGRPVPDHPGSLSEAR